MEIVHTTVPLALGLLSLALLFRPRVQIERFVVLLALLFLLVETGKLFDNEAFGQQFTYAFGGASALLFVLSYFLRGYAGLIFGVLVAFVPFFFWKEQQLVLDYEMYFDLNNILPIAPLVALFAAGARLKVQLMSKWFGIEDLYAEGFIHFIGIALLVMLSSALGSYLAFTLLAWAYTGVQFFAFRTAKNDDRIAFSLIIFGLLYITFLQQGELSLNLSDSSVLIGLLAGVGFHRLYQSIDQERMPSKGIISVILTVLTGFILVRLDSVKEHLAGWSAFYSYLLVLAFLSAFLHFKQAIRVALFLLLAFMYFALPEAKKPENTIAPTEAVSTPSTPTVIDPLSFESEALEEFKGSWKILPEASRIDFELGPKKARTKGYFGKLNATFRLSKEQDISKGIFDLELPVLSLSTNNDYRDKSLYSAQYFNAEKWPTIRIRTQEIVENNGFYLANGTITMMGVNKPITVKLKVKRHPKGVQVTAIAQIDRTAFGQASDPKIGNLVDVVAQLVFTT